MILHQHAPFASMMCKAIAFCETMLSISDVLYPFAVLAIDNDIQCVFTPNSEQEATEGMIEELEVRINERKVFAESAVSLLVYSATIKHATRESTDAIVFTITDSAGKNTVTVYPYALTLNGIKFEKPYTCDFSD